MSSRDLAAPREAPGRSGPARDAVTGVVLCGGASRRMGRDKALLPLGGEPLIRRALVSLQPVAGALLLACGPEPRYADLGLPLILDEQPDGGPLAGLAAALEAAATDWVCVLACDLPRASSEVLAALIARAASQDLDVCCLRTEAGLEPLFGVYHRRALPAVRAALAGGERRMVAFHDRTLAGRAMKIGWLEAAELPPEQRECAVNLNTPADYQQEQTR